ncbi:hypothetical protein C5B90_19090 [Haloferax sp. Atlit-12N]|uniref:hypothetical protein n=1 Tax=Haloferax sp. Atlit-12N TaxID=2077203 RepID=UPI000E24D4DB|nr:hypothetical protein [Haloferax sp. Atlit-12N]RDZ61380.1 hypothetical protein C5B90_19090 [Haloferax sp. Atlit-12N]
MTEAVVLDAVNALMMSASTVGFIAASAILHFYPRKVSRLRLLTLVLVSLGLLLLGTDVITDGFVPLRVLAALALVLAEGALIWDSVSAKTPLTA